MPEDRLLSPEEVAEHLGVSRLTAVRWMRSGKLKGQKFGKKTVRMKASDLEAFIAQQQPTLTLVDAPAPTHESTHIADQLDANTVALAMKLQRPRESLSGVVRRALEALQQAQQTQGPTPKGPMFSDQRRDILALLRRYPEGLSPAQTRQLLGTDKDLGSTMKSMERDGMLRRLRPGVYAAASE